MADGTGIEWTDATWNPVRGCSRVSEGCRNCYAERVAARFSGPGYPYEGLAKNTKNGPRWTGKVRLVPEQLEQPLRWTRPRRIFVNSMSDLFHEGLSFLEIGQVFEVMEKAKQHTFQVLTKRASRMREFMEAEFATEPPPPNVWLGVSVEDQAAAVARIPHLLETPAAVRFLSVEPLLGPVGLTVLEIVKADPPHGPSVVIDALRGVVEGPDDRTGKIDWVIVGGESGPGARPMHPDWARAIREQCLSAGTPFLFKQWGDWVDVEQFSVEETIRFRGEALFMPGPGKTVVQRIGKKAAGRLLDGRAWDQYPGAAP